MLYPVTCAPPAGVALSITKVWNASPDYEPSPVTLTGSFIEGSYLLDETNDWSVPAGTISFAEAPVENFSTAIECAIGDEPSTPVTGDGASIELDVVDGSTVVCTITNTELATVGLTKVSDDDTDGRIFDFTLSGTEQTLHLGADDVATFTAVPIATSTVTETPVPGWRIESVTCDDQSIEHDDDSFEVTPAPGAAIDCVVANERVATIDKTAVSLTPTDVAGEYLADYDITVTNSTATAVDVVVGDQFAFGAGVVPTGSFVVDVPEDITANAAWDGQDVTQLTHGFRIAGGTQVVIGVTVRVAIDPELTEAERACPAPGDSEQALNNTATLFLDGWDDTGELVGIDSATACLDIPAPGLQVTKSIEEGPVYDTANGTWTISYMIDVVNTGSGVATYELVDTPAFSDRVAIDSVSVFAVESETEHTYDAAPTYPLADGVVIGADGEDRYRVTFVFRLDGSTSPADVCASVGTGLFNTVTLSGSNELQLTDTACADLPQTHIMIDKEVVGLEYLDADTVGVQFTITVTNDGTDESPAYPEQYVFIDVPIPALGVDPAGLEVLAIDGGTEGEDVEFELGTGPAALMATGLLAAGGSHVWHIGVVYSVDLLGFDGECRELDLLGGAPLGGLSNVVVYASGGGGSITPTDVSPLPFGFDLACVPVSSVTFDKTAVNDDGGSLNPGDVVFEVRDGSTVVRTGHSGDTLVIASGDYTVVEQPVAGYTSSGVTCAAVGGGPDDGDLSDTAVRGPGTTFLPDYEYLCSATNDDEPVDLRLTKSDGGATLVAGGAPVTYTFTVTNAGGRAADAGDDAVLTDVLPAGLAWVAGSVTGCTSPVIAGQTLTCTVPAAQLAAGATVAVTAKASLPAAGASGDYVDVASVGNADDPAPGTGACPSGSDNVACETTPAVRQATLTATKVSDATGPKVTGDLVAYTLKVTNNGPSTVLPGTVLTDDLPQGLALVSVSGTGWTCGNSDPVVCSSNDVIGVGETLPAVVITTRVTATGATTITNTGGFSGIVDVDGASGLQSTSLRRGEAAVIVTVTASATAVASILVNQESAAPGPGAPSAPGPLPSTGGSPLGVLYVAAAAVGIGLLLLRLRRLHQAR